MRLAITISFAVLGLAFSAVRAEELLVRVTAGSHSGYIVSEKYAEEHKTDLVASMPGPVKIEGFWTPLEQDVAVADRVFRDLIRSAAKDPSLLFPDLKQNSAPDASDSLDGERKELDLVSRNYDDYLRQYVGIIVGAHKLIFCNYVNGLKFDPAADYIFIQKVFVPDGTVHFLQCRFDPESKTCSNVAMIGSWQPPAK